MNLSPKHALPQTFYERDTLEVARDLLGKSLVRRSANGVQHGLITETEAYCGPHDLACHASKGRTKRTEVMFGAAGHWYIYLIYGMYHCLNVVTEAEDYPAAVLIRGIAPITGVPPTAKTDGPGKLCRAMEIDRTLNAAPVFTKRGALWIADSGCEPAAADVRQTPRIGVGYAGEYTEKPWRFLWEPPVDFRA